MRGRPQPRRCLLLPPLRPAAPARAPLPRQPAPAPAPSPPALPSAPRRRPPARPPRRRPRARSRWATPAHSLSRPRAAACPPPRRRCSPAPRAPPSPMSHGCSSSSSQLFCSCVRWRRRLLLPACGAKEACPRLAAEHAELRLPPAVVGSLSSAPKVTHVLARNALSSSITASGSIQVDPSIDPEQVYLRSKVQATEKIISEASSDSWWTTRQETRRMANDRFGEKLQK